ncbi:hypothetical protein [Oryzifoliimicrobium ureilyticus]|uniref:hypothetical protein n=1 Tax=Oryzifoliimicrobium ureilyticus TaxID=3113724 RepID=UPI003076525A
MKESEYLSHAAAHLSSAAVLASLIRSLVDKEILSEDEETSVYDGAIRLLSDNAGDDEEGIFELAQELVETRWKGDSY